MGGVVATGMEQEVSAGMLEYTEDLNRFRLAQAQGALKAIQQLEKLVSANKGLLDMAKRREALGFEYYDKAQKAEQDAQLLKNSAKKSDQRKAARLLKSAKQHKIRAKTHLDSFKQSCTRLNFQRTMEYKLLKIVKAPQNKAHWDALSTFRQDKITRGVLELHRYLQERQGTQGFRPKLVQSTLTRWNTY